jgi:SAM-dependent methyltransferase
VLINEIVVVSLKRIDDMNDGSKVIENNLKKWETLPAGGHRKNVIELMNMVDSQLLDFYRECIYFWENERGWDYKIYSDLFKNKSVLELGSGLGYDGIIYSRSVRKWTFTDIVPINIEFIKRITMLLNIKNVNYQFIDDIFNHNFKEMFEAFYAHGVLHHVPFKIAQKEFININKYLNSNSLAVFLMYPYERWEICGKPDFNDFGRMTDGENTPWAEYYDEKKIKELTWNGFQLKNTIKWGHQNSEFVNFELEKLSLLSG